jgi:hypothetical protein
MVELRIRKLRKGSYFSAFLEPPRHLLHRAAWGDIALSDSALMAYDPSAPDIAKLSEP